MRDRKVNREFKTNLFFQGKQEVSRMRQQNIY